MAMSHGQSMSIATSTDTSQTNRFYSIMLLLTHSNTSCRYTTKIGLITQRP